MINRVVVEAPATVSNVGPGFDILGFSTEVISDVVEINIEKGERKITIENIGERALTPLEPTKNTAGIAAIEFLNFSDANFNVRIKIEKKIGIGTGLGSSAASAVATVFGLNLLLQTNLPYLDLIKIAMKGERASAGEEHADNIAPALLGGFTLIKNYNPIEIIKIENKLDLFLLILLPAIEIDTKQARNLLRENVPLKTLVKQSGNLASLIYAITRGEKKLFLSSFKDLIIEPQRKKLIPYYDEIREQALTSGGKAFGISGAGPALIVWTENKETAEKTGRELVDFLKEKNLNSIYFVTGISTEGARLAK